MVYLTSLNLYVIILVVSFKQNLNFKIQMLAANSLISFLNARPEENSTLIWKVVPRRAKHTTGHYVLASMKNATTFIVGFRYHASLKKLVIFSFFLDYHFMFLFPRYNEDVIKTTRFVDSNPPRWPDFFTLAYTLYPKNVTRPKGKKLSQWKLYRIYLMSL